ncbi:MAG: hypothetical protein V5A52_03400 [Halovenus sp.]
MSTTHQTGPPKTSSALVGVLALFAVVLFLREVPVRATALIGFLGAVSLTASLWLVDTETELAGRLVVSLLTIPVAAGFIVGIFGTTLLLIGSFFPVETVSDVSVATLIVLGNLGVVVGTGVAIFGVTLGMKNVIAPTALTAYTRTAVATALVPLVTGSLLVTSIALREGSPAGVDLLFESQIDGIWTALVSPGGRQLHLASFLLIAGAAAGICWLLLRRFPFESLVGSGGDDGRQIRQRATKLGPPRRVGLAFGGLTVGVLLAELLLSPAEIQSLVTVPLYDLVQVVTTADWLRLLLLGTTTVGAIWLGLSVLLEELPANRQTDRSVLLAPLVVGSLWTLLAAAVSESVYTWLVTEIASQLPSRPAAEMLTVSGSIETVYGSTPLIVLLSGIFLGVSAAIGVLLLGGVRSGYLAAAGTGFSVACAGFCLAAISASIVSAPSWLVLGGIAVGLAVWDIGHFGTTVGHEVGEGATGQLVAVRASTTLLVGVAGVALAVGLQRWLAADGFDASPRTTLALVLLVTSLVAFANALR